MKKRLLSLALAVLMLCSLVPGAQAALTPASSYNENAQTYHDGDWNYDRDGNYYIIRRWASVPRSYLFAAGSNYCRVEYISGSTPRLVVETYSASGAIQSQKELAMELPIFGGFFAGADANFVVFGQENPNESDSAEIIRVVRYSKSWTRQGSASLYGENTTIPFDGGSLRMTEDANYLYVHTCHEMYANEDGEHHQANLTFAVRKSSMTVTDVRSIVMNRKLGYVSHSFNQFVALDGNQIVTLDHGDAGPRSAYLYRCAAADGSGQFLPSFENDKRGAGVNLMTFPEWSGTYNATGANLGGLVVTDTHYLAAGGSVDPFREGADLDHAQRNIFVCAVPKSSFSDSAVKTYWLTSYPASDTTQARISTPHLVAMPDGGAMVLWTVEGEGLVHYRMLGADGAPVGSEATMPGALSDCAPVVADGRVLWYVTTDSAPAIYAIEQSAKPTITAQPKAVTAAAGSTVQFTVSATGGNLTYQWQYKSPGGTAWNNSSMTGAKTATLTVTATAARNGQQYRCVVSDGSAAYTSDAAVLHVNLKPVIQTQPKSVTVNEGASATFTVSASGPDLRYQWQYKIPGGTVWNNSTMTGAKTATLTVPATAARNGQQYRCVVKNAAGSTASNAAKLTVLPKPSITAQPKAVSAAVGSTVKFTVSATGGNLSYQWQYKLPGGTAWNNSTMTGAKTATLTVTATAARNGQQYRCVVKNSQGSATSNAAKLTVVSKPSITTQPKAVTAAAGSTVKFTVSASGGGLSYQWQYKTPGGTAWYNSSMTGAKTATLTVTATAARNGQQYRCVVTNAAGSATSNAAKLTVR